jgi:hypothetical protein
MSIHRATFNGLTVVVWPEDIANNSAISVWYEGHNNVNCVPLIRCHYKHITFAEREKMVSHIALNIWIIPHLRLLSGFINLSNVLVHF